MKAVIQRCKNSSVIVNGETVGEISGGITILLGVFNYDTNVDAEVLARKTAALRIFNDKDDKMNLSLKDVGGEAMVVSNFTLCADTKKGNRPSYSQAMSPEEANEIYEYFCTLLENEGIKVEKGVFGADMQVEICGDGPVTVVLDTDIWIKKGESK